MTAPTRATLMLAAGTAAAITAHANAQTAFSWANPVDDAWSNTAAWTPTGSPGAAASVLDTAALGLTGPYTVNVNVTRTVASVDITNPEATLRIDPAFSLTITDALTSVGTTVISTGDSFADALFFLGNGATASGNIILNGFGTGDAIIAFANGPGESATLTGTISGTGTIDGTLNNQGTIRAAAGDTVVLSLTGNQLTGGTVDQDPTGNIIFNNHTLTDVTLTGDVRVDPAENINISTGVTFDAPVRVSTGDSFADAVLRILDGVTLNATVNLDGFGVGDARLEFPTAPGEAATLSATSTVSGVGTITGSLVNQGLIHANAGDTISLVITDAHLSGGTVSSDPAGNILWNNHTLSNITLAGDIRIDPGETINILDGVTFAGPANVSTGDSFADATIRVLNGITLDADVVLNGFDIGDARLTYPLNPGESATISATSTVVGTGTIEGRFNNQGLIHARDGDRINLAHADARIDGGTLQLDSAGDFLWNAHTLANTNLVGNILIQPSETLSIDTNVTFNDGVTISTGDSFADATLIVLNGVNLAAEVALNGFQFPDARLQFPTEPGESATIDATTTITGTGSILGRFTNNGLIIVAETKVLSLNHAESTLEGGTLQIDPDSDVVWNAHTLTDITINGNALIEPGETITLSTGVNFTDRLTINTGNSFADATVNLLPGVIFNDTATLNGFESPDARLAGPVTPSPITEGNPTATLGASSRIEGQGTILNNIPSILGTIAPGTDTTPQRINIDTATPTAFGPSTDVEITLFAPGSADIVGGNADLTLAGTLSLVPADTYIPTLGDEFIVIDGPARTGTFDTVSPIPGDSPYIVRARYEPTQVTAIITCLQDLSGDGITDIDDVLSFLDAFGNQDNLADLALPIGTFNIDDVLTFLNLFAKGCF